MSDPRPSLVCLTPPQDGAGYVEHFGDKAIDYHHEIIEPGGFWRAQWRFPRSVGVPYLRDWFANRLMFQIEERAGQVTWEGVVWEMELTLDGSRRLVSMADVWNAIRCDYTDGEGNPATYPADGWEKNDVSITRYLQREQIIPRVGITPQEAQSEVERALAQLSVPIARPMAVDRDLEEGLLVTAVGKIWLSNNQYSDTPIKIIRENTAVSATASTIVLDAGASAVDDYYNTALIRILSGTGDGQYRTIPDYVGATKTATVTPDWTTTPDSTSGFSIYFENIEHEGTLASATSTTAVLDSIVAINSDDIYNGVIIRILQGTGIGQQRMVDDYVGSTLTVTLNTAWTTTPDSTSVYRIARMTWASKKITRIITDHCDQLTAQAIIENKKQVPFFSPVPVRAWDHLREVVAAGNSTTPYTFHVEPGGAVVYKVLDNTLAYLWHGRASESGDIQGLTGPGRSTVNPWRVRPGVLRDMTVPAGTGFPNAFLDNRRDALITSVLMADNQVDASLSVDDNVESDLAQSVSRHMRYRETA